MDAVQLEVSGLSIKTGSWLGAFPVLCFWSSLDIGRKRVVTMSSFFKNSRVYFLSAVAYTGSFLFGESAGPSWLKQC